MMMNLHFNTETSLVLMYCLIMVATLLILSLPLPHRAKKPINDAIEKSLYYFGIAALLPLWTLINAVRNLNRFSQEMRDPDHRDRELPFMADKHKGRVIKMQRNLILAIFALVSYVLLFRFHKVISRFDDAMERNANAESKKVKAA